MRPRWPEYALVLGVVLSIVIGVLAIWGQDIDALLGRDSSASHGTAGPRIGKDVL